MKLLIRICAVLLALVSCFTLFIWALALGLQEGIYATPIWLERFWFPIIGVTALLQLIGSFGLLAIREWARRTVMVSCAVMATYTLAKYITPHLEHPAWIETIAHIFVPLSYVVLLGISPVKVVFRRPAEGR